MKFLSLFISFLISPMALICEVAEPICPCDIPSVENQKIIDDLFKHALIELEKHNAKALSGPDNGINKRIILLFDVRSNRFEEIINPEIIWENDRDPNHILISGYDRKCIIISKELFETESVLFKKAIDRLDREEN